MQSIKSLAKSGMNTIFTIIVIIVIVIVIIVIIVLLIALLLIIVFLLLTNPLVLSYFLINHILTLYFSTYIFIYNLSLYQERRPYALVGSTGKRNLSWK